MQSVVQPAILLQNETDNVYAFGIGTGIGESELESIATNKEKGRGWGKLTTFAEYESFIRLFIDRYDGCKTPKIQPYRKDISKIHFNQIKPLVLAGTSTSNDKIS